MTRTQTPRSADAPARGLTLFIVSTALLMIVLMSTPAAAAEPFPFTSGSTRLSLALGNGTAFNKDYAVFGLGGGYFVVDGIELGLQAEAWLGNSPHIGQLSPQVRMVIDREGRVKPYLGAFYRRTFIDGYRDNDTIGARAGLYFLTNGSTYFGAGLVQDVHLNCDRTVYSYCAETYPELLFAVFF